MTEDRAPTPTRPDPQHRPFGGPALPDFQGRWSLRRTILDRMGDAEGQFEGEATFTSMEVGLAYHEEGVLAFPGRPALRAERRYFWRDGPGGRIEVLFHDGRPFHDIEPGSGATATHLCAPDLYQVSYDFTVWPRWTATWQVSGPRKDYEMVSQYSRQA